MRARLGAVLLALSLGAAGCSSGEEPEAGPTLPPVAEAPSSTPEAVAVPSQAAEATPEGAAEFARFFYESVVDAFDSRDSRVLTAISDPGCEVCQRYIASVNRLRERDERIEGYAITLQDAVSPGDPGETTVVTVIYDSTAARRLDAAGGVIREEEARTSVVSDLVIRRANESWVVEQVQAK